HLRKSFEVCLQMAYESKDGQALSRPATHQRNRTVPIKEPTYIVRQQIARNVWEPSVLGLVWNQTPGFQHVGANAILGTKRQQPDMAFGGKPQVAATRDCLYRFEIVSAGLSKCQVVLRPATATSPHNAISKRKPVDISQLWRRSPPPFLATARQHKMHLLFRKLVILRLRL